MPSENSPDAENPTSSKVWRGRLTAISLLAGLLIVGLVLGFGPTVIRKYDDNHRVSIECMVIGAEADKGSASGRGSASWSQVVIRTSDCGTLLLTSGVNSSNREEVAAKLAEGGKFRIEIGSAEQALSWVNDLLDLSPRAWSFERID